MNFSWSVVYSIFILLLGYGMGRDAKFESLENEIKSLRRNLRQLGAGDGKEETK